MQLHPLTLQYLFPGLTLPDVVIGDIGCQKQVALWSVLDRSPSHTDPPLLKHYWLAYTQTDAVKAHI